jgi:hypothetical protein
MPVPKTKAAARRRRSAADIAADEDGAPVLPGLAMTILKEARAKWAPHLAKRKAVTAAEPSARSCENFKKTAEATQKRTRAKMGIPEATEHVDAEGCGLPPAKRSRRAADLERWCISGSSAMCEHCFVMQPRDMRPVNFDKIPEPTIPRKRCWRCAAKRQHLVPSSAEVPRPLRNLTEMVAKILAVMEVDCGPEVRSLQSNGYRQHSAMIRFVARAERRRAHC